MSFSVSLLLVCFGLAGFCCGLSGGKGMFDIIICIVGIPFVSERFDRWKDARVTYWLIGIISTSMLKLLSAAVMLTIPQNISVF